MKTVDVDRDLLSFLYSDKKLSSREIAKRLDIGQTTVLRYLRKYNIKIRSDSESKLNGREKLSKSELENLYLKEKLSTVKIGKKFGFPDNTIRRWMKEYGIKRRSISESLFKLRISKKELEDLYVNQGLSTNKIAKKFNLKGSEQVRRKLIHYGIKRRDSIDVRSVKVNISPSPELAYVLSVLKGDGGVCGESAIQLGTIDKIFAQSFYDALKKIGFRARFSKGGVTTKNNRIYHTAGASKQFVTWYNKLTLDDIYDLISKDKELIIEFLRGFYESEGHHDKEGYTSMSNANHGLLSFIQKLVLSLGISSKMYGPTISKRNPNWKSIYALRLNKENTFHFFCSIKPVIKFKKEIWEKSILPIVKKAVSKFKKELNVKKQTRYKIVSKAEMNNLLTGYSPYFLDKIKSGEITQRDVKETNTPFASSNSVGYSTIYICPENIAGLTKNEDALTRNIFIEQCIIHELLHIKINDAYTDKSEEEKVIIEETRRKYPYHRKIFENLFYKG